MNHKPAKVYQELSLVRQFVPIPTPHPEKRREGELCTLDKLVFFVRYAL